MTPFSPLLIVIIVSIIFIMVKAVEETGNPKKKYVAYPTPVKRRHKMMKFLFNRKINNLSMLFNGHYIDAKALYLVEMKNIPCISFISEIDVTKVFAYINENFGANIKHTYQHAYFDHTHGKTFFNNTIFIMANERMIELGNNYCHVLHNTSDYDWARNMLTAFAAFRIVPETPAATQVVGFARQTVLN